MSKTENIVLNIIFGQELSEKKCFEKTATDRQCDKLYMCYIHHSSMHAVQRCAVENIDIQRQSSQPITCLILTNNTAQEDTQTSRDVNEATEERG